LQQAEFRIVLCTGGPQIEVRGELNVSGRPVKAKLVGFWAGEQDVKYSTYEETLLDFAKKFNFYTK